jgi:hypothetical protein
MTTKSKLDASRYVRKTVKRVTHPGDLYVRKFPRGPYRVQSTPSGRFVVVNAENVFVCSCPTNGRAVAIAQILHLYDVASGQVSSSVSPQYTPPAEFALPGVPETPPKLTTREEMRHAEELLEIAAGLAHNELSGQVPRHTSTPAEIAEFRAQARKTLRLAALNYVHKLEASGQPSPVEGDRS